METIITSSDKLTSIIGRLTFVQSALPPIGSNTLVRYIKEYADPYYKNCDFYNVGDIAYITRLPNTDKEAYVEYVNPVIILPNACIEDGSSCLEIYERMNRIVKFNFDEHTSQEKYKILVTPEQFTPHHWKQITRHCLKDGEFLRVEIEQISNDDTQQQKVSSLNTYRYQVKSPLHFRKEILV